MTIDDNRLKPIVFENEPIEEGNMGIFNLTAFKTKMAAEMETSACLSWHLLRQV